MLKIFVLFFCIFLSSFPFISQNTAQAEILTQAMIDQILEFKHIHDHYCPNV